MEEWLQAAFGGMFLGMLAVGMGIIIYEEWRTRRRLKRRGVKLEQL